MCFWEVKVVAIRPCQACQGLIAVCFCQVGLVRQHLSPPPLSHPPRAAWGYGRRRCCRARAWRRWERREAGEGRRGKEEISLEECNVRLCPFLSTTWNINSEDKNGQQRLKGRSPPSPEPTDPASTQLDPHRPHRQQKAAPIPGRLPPHNHFFFRNTTSIPTPSTSIMPSRIIDPPRICIPGIKSKFIP